VEYILHILVVTGIYVILVLSLNLIVGYTGLPAFGHSAFACVGAYSSSLLMLRYGIPSWYSLLLGATLAGILGVLLSFPSLRLHGDYLALATFGFALIVQSIAQNWTSVTRGPMGISGIPGFSLFHYHLSSMGSYLALVLLFVLITSIVIVRLVTSPFGRVLRAIRDDEIAALSIGKDINTFKIVVFAVGAFFAGLAGVLYANYISFIDPSSFSVMESITLLLMVVFGGMGTIGGSFLGATVLVICPELLRFVGVPNSIAAPLRQMIYGLLLALLMLNRPQGLLGTYRLIQRS
jgi:branched-chain amino acid transport system permease protein